MAKITIVVDVEEMQTFSASEDVRNSLKAACEGTADTFISAYLAANRVRVVDLVEGDLTAKLRLADAMIKSLQKEVDRLS